MRYCFLVAALFAVGCSNSPQPPAPPAVDGSSSVSISGSEKLGWDQPASDFGELSTIGYEVYVDGAASTLAGVACSSTASAAGFECNLGESFEWHDK